MTEAKSFADRVLACHPTEVRALAMGACEGLPESTAKDIIDNIVKVRGDFGLALLSEDEARGLLDRAEKLIEASR